MWIVQLRPEEISEQIELGEDDEFKKTVQENEGMELWAEEEFFDNTTGAPLPVHLVKAAREEEIAFMEDWEVWDVVPVSRCWQSTGKGPLGGRWVDVNKGDTKKPNVRCRYVAKDIAYKKSDDFFAAMPPLEANKVMISKASERWHDYQD